MEQSPRKAIAIVGVGSILPDAPDTPTFWNNVKQGRYSIAEVPDERWDPALFWDPDPKAPDKAYSKIGGWVQEFEWNPLAWRLPIPPRVALSMDRTQKWALGAARQALTDYGWPERSLDPMRTAVILGNAMAGDMHYLTAVRIFFPEYSQELERAPSFAGLSAEVRRAITDEFHTGVGRHFPPITEDTMPGELANIIAGRVANAFDLHGPNFVCDAACASAMAALSAAVEGLEEHDYDAVITGGVDANMSASTFIKFCKIGALSATGTRPFAEGADGFVMGEGTAIFVLKRLEDAERDGDRVYAVIRGVGGSSDGRGKGITAPNPIGQRLSVERAWSHAGLSPATVTMIEGHGTSTKVGDVVEVESLNEVLCPLGIERHSIALGSVKSNIGHLKGAAGAAGILKAALSLHEKVLPPSLNFAKPNPAIAFDTSPLAVNTELRPWEHVVGGARRAGVSAFGFGGTNFHVVLEEHIPGRLTGAGRSRSVTVPALPATSTLAASAAKPPLRGVALVGGETRQEIVQRLLALQEEARAGRAAAPRRPAAADLEARLRIAIDYDDAAELLTKTTKALKALDGDNAGMWRALRSQGIHRGDGPRSKVAFLYTGQGSQYPNMLRDLAAREPIIAQTFAEADEVMAPILGRPLTEIVFADPGNPEALARVEEDLRQTAITQPAVLTVDVALTRLFAAYGVEPDMVMGHSLGEYGALVAAGALPFDQALEAVAARGQEMTRVSVEDKGWMAAVFAPLEEIEKVLEGIDGYVVVANINSRGQAVIGGATDAVRRAMEAMTAAGHRAVRLPVSHAFHTEIVSPASEPLSRLLRRLDLAPPRIPLVANVDGEFYPMDPNAVPRMVDILSRQIASPVQFVRGLATLFDAGARIFVEVGPKRALHGFVEDVLGREEGVLALFSNHPKNGDLPSFNQALAGLYSAGLGAPATAGEPRRAVAELRPAAASLALDEGVAPSAPALVAEPRPAVAPTPASPAPAAAGRPAATSPGDPADELGHMIADILRRGAELLGRGGSAAAPAAAPDAPVVVTGAALGLPGLPRVFDDAYLGRLLRGEQLIGAIPMELRRQIVDKNIVRVVKTRDGDGSFETISSSDEVLKLAARAGALDLVEEFGFPKDRIRALDTVTKLAIGAGIDALRDAGVPLAMRYKTTTKGTLLPERWGLPDALRDETGVIFASAFPGYDSFAREMRGYYLDRAVKERLADLETLRGKMTGPPELIAEVDARIRRLSREREANPYQFERRFLFRVLSMGHSQFAELIGARGPNTAINAACASGTQAVGLAEDWIRAGRCRRVVVVSADNITGDELMGWFGAGFLASGAAATDERVEDAVLPFDRRRHGLVVGMGAAALVVESEEAARERALAPLCQVLSTTTANSAFHGSRLDIQHIQEVMEGVVAKAERRWGIDRHAIAAQTIFMSHETYTPARGGSAQAEVDSLRQVFGEAANQIVIANTKGFTGHPMAVAMEDVVAIKALETGIVPPVPNLREIDPDLGRLNLSRGGSYPVEYVLRLGAGFGSQIAMSLVRRVAPPDGRRRSPEELGYAYRVTDRDAWRAWLQRISGRADAELEIVRRTLRVKDPALPAEASVPAGLPAQVAAPTTPAVQAPTPVAVPVAGTEPAPEPVPVSPAGDPIQQRVLTIVAAQTGYPPEMLAPDLDLEADLGIDTVKQAEMFAAIRSEWDIPREDDLQLRDFPTLADAVRFVRERRPDLAAAVPAAPAPPAPTPAAPAAPPATPAAAGAGADDPVRAKVLAIVAQQTGYPADMLDPDLDLEADLGIDTVKQAEMFAAIRSEWDIPREDDLQLRDFPTLADAVRFVRERRPDLAAAAAAAPAPPAPTPAAPAAPPATPAAAGAGADDPVRAKVLAIVAQQTGYPADMLDPDLDLEADLGIDTVKQAEMFAAIRSEWDIPREDDLQLRDFPTLADAVRFVRERRPDLAPAAAPVAAAQAAQTPVVQTPVVQPAAAPAATPPAAAPADDPVRAKVLAIVAQQTGYPADMLDPDLDLEADLGIDTVKQAEMFAAIRSEWDIPREDDLQLRDFPTLADAVRFVFERRPDLTPAGAPAAPTAAGAVAPTASAAPPPASEATAAGGPRPSLMRGDLEATARVPRRVAVAQLRPDLALCRATGVALGKGSRVVVVLDEGGVGRALAKRLEKLGAEVLAAPSDDDLAEAIAAFRGDEPVQGVFWLPALDSEGDPYALAPAAWRSAVRRRVKNLYALERALYEDLGRPGSFLVSATRLGGRHGYDEAGALAPLGGAVVGLTKTFQRERPETLAKAVDFPPSRKTAALADALLEEVLADPGAVEIGRFGDRRWTVGLEEQPFEEGGGLELGRESVVVVTGAAGSIVSAITADLAAASGATFYLLDLAPAPDPEDPDLRAFVEDRDGLKLTLFARMKEAGERPTPAKVERHLAGFERAASALAGIQAVAAAGGQAHYRQLDLRDGDAIAGVVDEIRERHGRVDLLLHAGGLEISRLLPDKEPAEFDLVFDVKADGWYHLMRSIGSMPLGAAVVFSSVAGRFGNTGQADYSAANDLLSKAVSSFRGTRQTTRGIALDWTAWGGIGMATRGSIPTVMREAGIEMLPPEAGIPLIRREVTGGPFSGEMVVGLALGILVAEKAADGGVDLGPEGVLARRLADAGVMAGVVTSFGQHRGLVVESRLDPKEQPFLDHHRIDGTPVLPGVMGIEAFATAARLAWPELRVAGVEDVQFLAPFKFFRDEPRTVSVRAVFTQEGDDIVASCRLSGSRDLPGRDEPVVTTHFTGRVRLTSEPLDTPVGEVPQEAPEAVDSEAIYRLYFHGPAYQVMERAWRNGGKAAGRMTADLPANHRPEELPSLMDPRLIELCFQTAGLLQMGTRGTMGLPASLQRVTRTSLPLDGGPLYAVVEPSAEGAFGARVVDGSGRVAVVLEAYRTVELPGSIAEGDLAPVKRAMDR